MYYGSSNYYHNYLAHYGIKGMKWGVRRARNKAARQNYKAAKKRANVAYNKAQGQHRLRTTKADVDFTYNGKSSRQDMLIKKFDSTRQLNKDATKYRTDKAAAKRDYKIAKGKNTDRANKKYNRAVLRAKNDQTAADQRALDELYKASPKAAKHVAKMGKVKTSDLNMARINAGLDAVNAAFDGYNLYSDYKKRKLRSR